MKVTEIGMIICIVIHLGLNNKQNIQAKLQITHIVNKTRDTSLDGFVSFTRGLGCNSKEKL